MLVGIRARLRLAIGPRRPQRLPEPPLRPHRSRRRAESGPRRCGPSQSDRPHPGWKRNPGACPMINIFGPGCRFKRIPFDSLMEDHMKYMLLIYNEEKAWPQFIEAKNLDEAIAIAARVPSVSAGTVEVRPLVERPAQATA